MYPERERMDFNTVQTSWLPFSTNLNQSMTSEGQTLAQNAPANQYIDLQAVGRQQILGQYLESYPQQNGVIYPSCEKSLTEQPNQAMICLTEFQNHTNGESI